MSSTPQFEEWNIVRCYGLDFRRYLKELADTIDILELWDWFKNESPPKEKGYMFWGHENVSKISNKLDELYGNDHSGASFGFAMRCMQAIAKRGFDNWNKNNAEPG